VGERAKNAHEKGAGRRAARDPEGTREKILSQAMAEFATKGFDGARVDSIAARCRLSKNMLYHYYKSKEGLFIAVLERMYEKLRVRQRDFAILARDPVEAMRELVAHTFNAFLEHPEVIALLNSENLHKGKHLRKSRRIKQLYDPLVDAIREVLRRGGEQGVFRSDIDPITLYISLSSLAYHYISNQYTLKTAFGVDFTSEERRKTWLAHITDMIVLYCQGGARQQGRELVAAAPTTLVASARQRKA
jgi:TetR/AcrR family transcriptional regulator